MAEVFISYKREERDGARRLAEALEGCGFSVWWDADLLPGEQYRRVTLEILDNCKAAIVMWSAQSVVSGWVLDEAQRAQSKGKLIPVRGKGFTDYPLGFGQLHAHDLEEWDGDPEALAFRPVVSAVERLTSRPRERRPEASPAPQPSSSSADVEREVAVWRGVSETRDPDDLIDYLEQFGENALFGNMARRRLAGLRSPAVSEPTPAKPLPAVSPSPVKTRRRSGNAGHVRLPSWAEPAIAAALIAASLLTAPLIALPIADLLVGLSFSYQPVTFLYQHPLFLVTFGTMWLSLLISDQLSARISQPKWARSGVTLVVLAVTLGILAWIRRNSYYLPSGPAHQIALYLTGAAPIIGLHVWRTHRGRARALQPANSATPAGE